LDKRQQVLDLLQELPEEYLDTALDMLQLLQKKKRLQALKTELSFINSRPIAKEDLEHRTWKREDLYDRK
jgi:hypothetical protein